eukprot:Gb_30374 [translate_table: standard]
MVACRRNAPGFTFPIGTGGETPIRAGYPWLKERKPSCSPTACSIRDGDAPQGGLFPFLLKPEGGHPCAERIRRNTRRWMEDRRSIFWCCLLPFPVRCSSFGPFYTEVEIKVKKGLYSTVHNAFGGPSLLAEPFLYAGGPVPLCIKCRPPYGSPRRKLRPCVHCRRTNNRYPNPMRAELVRRVIGNHFAQIGGHLSAFVAYNVNLVADQFQRAFKTSTSGNRLYCFFNRRWFFDQVLNDFIVRSFLRFGCEVSFEASDKGVIDILGPYGISYTFRQLAKRMSQLQSGFVVRGVRRNPWPPAWWGAAPPLWVNGKPDSTNPRKGSSSGGVKTGAL